MADAEKKQWVAVKQVGLAADRNSRHRRKMEVCVPRADAQFRIRSVPRTTVTWPKQQFWRVRSPNLLIKWLLYV
jgi:hypothetical protein